MPILDGELVRRSLLFVPANVPRFVDSAWTRGADAILLDLEDSIPPDQKEQARALIKEDIPKVGKGGAEVFVRVNHSMNMAVKDAEASIWPGLTGIQYPKASVPEIHELEKTIAQLEEQRGLEAGSLEIMPLIESAEGIMNAFEIASCSPRIKQVGGGVNIDVSLQIGAEPGPETPWMITSTAAQHFPSVRDQMILACVAAGVQPQGTGGGPVSIRDVEGLYKSAVLGRQMGFKAAMCIHPAQVGAFNRGFTLTREEVEYAKKALELFEEGLKKGTATVSFEGRMVDIPVAERAKKIVARAEAVEKWDKKKRELLKAAGADEEMLKAAGLPSETST